MKYYSRTTTIKDYQGSHHKAVFVSQRQYFKSNDEKFIAEAQKGLKIKFKELDRDSILVAELRKLEKNKIYKDTEKLTDREIYFRPSISKRW